jgi:septum formation inhibitor-activating ATPase MinD
MSPAKQQVISLLDSLPDNCSLDDIQYHLYVLTKIKKSEERIKAGDVLSQEDVKQRLSQWLGR